MKAAKKTRPLPTRGGLNDLGKTGRTITDYAKASPTLSKQAEPSAVINLANPRKGR